MSRFSRYITAKQLEDEVEMDERHIRRPETQRRLGIDKCRDRTCKRPLRWPVRACAEALRQRGYDVHFDEPAT